MIKHQPRVEQDYYPDSDSEQRNLGRHRDLLVLVVLPVVTLPEPPITYVFQSHCSVHTTNNSMSVQASAASNGCVLYRL
jgi:hypothetical protein